MRTHRYVFAATVTTFLLLIAGGLVHATGSSLACPDWPLCYGHFFPRMVGGVQFEHGHRLLALVVVCLTGLCAYLYRRQPGLRRLAFIAVGLVLAQAVLGGITVIYRLPVPVSTAHLGLAMFFFAFLVHFTVRAWPAPVTQPAAGAGAKPAAIPASVERMVAVAVAVLYLQILLGALVKHTGSSLACFDVPLCGGRLWPAGAAMRLQMAHRIGALVATIVILYAATRAIVAARKVGLRSARRFAAASHLLVIVQVVLGVWSVLSGLNVAVATSHLAVGALLLGDLVALRAVLLRHAGAHERSRARDQVPEGSPVAAS